MTKSSDKNRKKTTALREHKLPQGRCIVALCYKMPHLIRPLHCRPLMNDNIS